MTSRDLPTCDVLGVAITVGTVESAADAVVERALSRGGGYGVLCNVHVLITACREPDVMDAVRGAWAVFPDGAPVAWMQRREGRAEAGRIGGPDLMPAVVDRGRAHGLRHAFVGSTPDVVGRLTQNLAERFPADLASGLPGRRLRGDPGASTSGSRGGLPRRLARAGRAEAGAVDESICAAPRAGHRHGRRSRIRLPRRDEEPSTCVDAKDWSRSGFTAYSRNRAGLLDGTRARTASSQSAPRSNSFDLEIAHDVGGGAGSSRP